MKKKKLFLSIALCAALFLCISSNASAVLVNQTYSGDRVVYDTLNDLYWYPILTDFTGMNRSEQEAAIDSLVYGGSSDWRIATWCETTTLRVSLSEMATVDIMPTTFAAFGVLDEGVRTVSSPFLAWEVDSAEFFTPTGVFDMGFATGFEMMADVFNGRTSDEAWGFRNNGDGNPAVWAQGGADDHWVSHTFMNDGGDGNLTMTFNFDQHLRDDEATEWMMGGIGAWVVTSSVPEPATMLLFGSGLLVLAGLGRRKFKKG